jgi:hypothetical protein
VLEQQAQRLAARARLHQRQAERREHGLERAQVLRPVIDEQDPQLVDDLQRLSDSVLGRSAQGFRSAHRARRSDRTGGAQANV